jgi:threonine aldolase
MKMIDLRSDTVTRPSKAMRKAMAEAEVGDDVFRDDPTVLKLEAVVAELFEKEAALFVPSGTMGNQVCLKTLSEPGWEILCDRESHILNYETAGPAIHSQLLVNMLDTNRGVITAEKVENLIRIDNIHCPITKIVEIENTHNRHGGTIHPLDEIIKVRIVSDKYGLLMHLDGARLWNAYAATGISLADWTAPFDSVSVCFSKGMGAPVGSMIMGNKDFIDKALRTRKLFGGGMRQVGILAAAALYAIENNLKRLVDDHANARLLAEGIDEIDGFDVDLSRVETNIIIADISSTGKDPGAVVKVLADNNVLCVPFGPTTVRFVTHLDVSTKDIKKALEIISALKWNE